MCLWWLINSQSSRNHGQLWEYVQFNFRDCQLSQGDFTVNGGRQSDQSKEQSGMVRAQIIDGHCWKILATKDNPKAVNMESGL